MNAQDLKNSILQRAIEGKLVPQRKEEGTALDILQDMNSYIEKKHSSNVECDCSSMEYDIPSSWRFVELNHILKFVDYRGKTPHKIDNGIFLITASNIKKGYLDYTRKEYISEEEYLSRQSRGITEKGDILFTTEAPLGNCAINKCEICSCGQRIITFKAYQKGMLNLKLFMYFILSPHFQKQLLDNCTGTTAKGIKAAKLKHLLIPLPPLAEQHRIVAKIEEFQPDIDAYDKAQTKLQAIEQRFPDDMKKSLLQYAIEGKLVPQRKEEGTAKDLLTAIRAEKAQLIKEKKIKKTKPLPAITDDEKPYAIPDSWEWRRLGDISTIVTGGTPSKSQPLYYGGNVPFYKPADIQDNKYVNTPKEFLSIMGKEKAKFVPKGSVAVNCIGNIGKSAILPRDGATNQQINSICYYIYPDYLYWFCQSMMFILQLKKVSSMTTIPIVNKSKVEQCIIPLPPLAEQHRIVAKLEELLPLCQHLTDNP